MRSVPALQGMPFVVGAGMKCMVCPRLLTKYQTSHVKYRSEPYSGAIVNRGHACEKCVVHLARGKVIKGCEDIDTKITDLNHRTINRIKLSSYVTERTRSELFIECAELWVSGAGEASGSESQ